MDKFTANSRQWLVIEDDPHPDDYIVIIAPGWTGTTLIPYSTHLSEGKAKGRARQLMSTFHARRIKVFYPDGHSRILR